MLGLWFALAVAGPAKHPPRKPKPKPAPVQQAASCSHHAVEVTAKILDRRFDGKGVRIVLNLGSARGVAVGDAGSLRIDGKDVACFKIVSVNNNTSTAEVTIRIELVDQTEVRLQPTRPWNAPREPGAVG